MLARGGRYLWPPKLLYHRSIDPTQHKRHWQPHFKNLPIHLSSFSLIYKFVRIQERLMCTRCCWLVLKTIQMRLGLPRCGFEYLTHVFSLRTCKDNVGSIKRSRPILCDFAECRHLSDAGWLTRWHLFSFAQAIIALFQFRCWGMFLPVVELFVCVVC